MLPVLVVSLLTACAGVNSNPATACPPIKDYDRKLQNKLADEIEEASPDAAFPVVLQDYGLLRAQIREGCH